MAKSKHNLTRKERKRLRKATRAQQDALEKKLVEQGAISRRVRYIPRSFLWNILAVLLAFLFGLFAALGAILGLGYYSFSKTTVKELLALFGGNADDFLYSDYSEKTVLGLTEDVMSTLSELGGGNFTLNTIGKYTPMIQNTMNSLAESLATLGITLDTGEFMAQSISDLGTYLQENVIDGMVLGKALNLNKESSSMMLALCYGSEGDDYTFDENGEIVMKEGKNPLTLGELKESNVLLERVEVEDALGITPDSNAAMLYLAYGTLHETYDIVETENGKTVVMRDNPATGKKFPKKKLSDLTSDKNSPIDDAKISDLIDVSDATGIIAAIKDWKVSDLKNANRIQRLRIGQVIEEGETPSRLIRAISSWRIGDLTDQSKVDSLTLGDVLEIDDSSRLLSSLKDTGLGELNKKVDSLRLSDIIDPAELADNKLLKNLADSSLASLSEDVKSLTVRDVYGEEIYSHMEIVPGQPSYADIIANYDHTKDPNGGDTVNTLRPTAIDRSSVITSKIFAKGQDTELSLGWFTEKQGAGGAGKTYVLAEELFTEKTQAEEEGPVTINRFAERRVKLEPVNQWYVYDYDVGAPAPIDNSAFSTVTEGYADGSMEDDGTAVTELGLPLYYHTERTFPPLAEGEAERTELVRYPVKEDDFGYYYRYLTAEGKGVRVDLERLPASYTAEDGTEVPFAADGSGQVVYGGQNYNVYTQKAVSEGEETTPGYEYLKIKEQAAQYYYAPSEGVFEYETVYGSDETEEKLFAEIPEREGLVPVERYLAGAWFLLFGKDEEQDGHNVVVDATDKPVLEISDIVTDTKTALNDMPLWQMWLHGIIDANPYKQLPLNNVNEMTIAELIRYATGI